MSAEIFLDSNIFRYAFNDADVGKQAIAKSVLLADRNCAISAQVVNEVSNNLLKRFGRSNADVLAFIEDCYTRYEVADISQDVFMKAVVLRERYQFSYYDSVIVAAALLMDCSSLYSEDMHHDLVVEDNLVIVNPFV